jgi:GNAT superfamily N-acetyltransferase
MEISFREATANDAELIGGLVVALTTEITEITKMAHFDIDLQGTVERCKALIRDGHYAGLIAHYNDVTDNSVGQNTSIDNKAPNKEKVIVIAVVTMSETYALYAAGKIGVIQEFYVYPEQRDSGVGSMLIEQVKIYGKKHNWSCIELCTPPLPEFARTLNFYQKSGLNPVGGRKMRLTLS